MDRERMSRASESSARTAAAVRCWVALALCLNCVTTAVRAAEPVEGSALAIVEEGFFEQKIRPVLAETCFRCHGGQEGQPEGSGGLRVDSREHLRRGGESGPALAGENQPIDPNTSLLLRALRREEDVAAMPPDKPLRPDQIEDFTRWIAAGAPWPERSTAFLQQSHWAFESPVATPPPAVRDTTWPRTSLDAFILARQEALGARPAPEADRRNWLRRVTYDLTGLPPTADELDAFQNDPRPEAHDEAIERLLQSPRYGEHWGRHWLDVVRYADTAGENSDHPLPHAWRYRNWVIDALNQDKSYRDFIQEQIAGDLLAAQGPAERYTDRVIATGYLAIARRFGHDIDQDMHLTLEDAIDTLGKSVLGLTIGCARCHEHKFDPLSSKDYYGLYGILASTKFAFPGCEPKQQPRDLVPIIEPGEFARRTQPVRDRIAELDRLDGEARAAMQVLAEQARTRVDSARTELASGSIADGGSSPIISPEGRPALTVALRKSDAIRLQIAPKTNHGADTTRLELTIRDLSDSERSWSLQDLVADQLRSNPFVDPRGKGLTWVLLDARHGDSLLLESARGLEGKASLHAWRNGNEPSVLVNTSEQPLQAWTQLAPRSLFVHPAADGPVAIAWIAPAEGTYTLAGSIADAHAGGGDGVVWSLERIASHEYPRQLTELGRIAGGMIERQAARRELESQLAMPVAYAVVEGEAKDAKIQVRGNPADLGEEVPRRFLSILGGQAVEQKTASGRLELARWLTSDTNPLTARVIVNRVWQWHFGRGLVATPNDFGQRGAPPTHPELLDDLAVKFMENGWSLKWLHREILRSATYRQSSLPAEESEAILASTPTAADLWMHFPRRRLSAEELRDSLLIASGELDLEPGTSHPFPPESTWSFTQHGPFAAEYETRKRSVYVMQKRNRRLRFFALFDGADPNASTPKRDMTMVPTQALFFMNDPFVHGRAERIAERALEEGSGADDRSRLRWLYRQILGRVPAEEEEQEALSFLEEYQQSQATVGEAASEDGLASSVWAAYARILLASNEHVFID